MTMLYRQQTNLALGMDGCFGFFDGTANYVVGGWQSGPITYKTVYKSVDNGLTWTSEPDFDYHVHTIASTMVGNVPYLVGGDVYSPTLHGGYVRKSFKWESGAWVQIAADCGIQDRCLAALCELNGDFYLYGGQRTFDPADGVYDTVMRSTDNCASFSVVNSDTKPTFRGGNHWGAWVTYEGKMWKIGGGIYRTTTVDREHDTAIYSTTDGVTFTYEGEFPGVGRHYHQAFVHCGKIYILGGYNGVYGPNSGNMNDSWSAQVVSGRLVWTSEGLTDFSGVHALSAWSTPNGIMVAGGSNPGTTAATWLIRTGDERVATPTLTESGGQLSMACATSGVSIYYTTDGSTPTLSSTLYSSPISVDTSTGHVKAVGVLSRRADSLPGVYRGSSVGALDGQSNLWLVVSTRRLRSAYTGNILQVRRASDNALANIGYSGFEIDGAALSSHIGVSQGYVRTAYDQSGNARDMARTSGFGEPQVLSPGRVNSVAFSGTDGTLGRIDNTGTLPEAFTVALWAMVDSLPPGSIKAAFDCGGGVASIQVLTTNALRGLVYVGSNKTVEGFKTLAGQWAHLCISYDGSNLLRLFVDGWLIASLAAGNITLSQANINLMGTSNANAWPGDTQDLIILDTALTTEAEVKRLMV